MNKKEFKKQLIQIYDEDELEAIWRWLHDEFQLEKELVWEIWIAEIIEGLKQNKPLQQLLNKAYFFDLELKVNEHVLIPRPETEELVSWISELNKNRKNAILDLGTGSGCIALALKKRFPASDVHAMDVSEEALKVAEENGKILDLKVNFFQGDLNCEPKSIANGFDIIVSNPPYIAVEESSQMNKNVLDYEPDLALFAPKDNPVWFYERIRLWTLQNLKPNGEVFLEINPLFINELKNLFSSSFSDLEFKEDISGKLRFLRVSGMK